jgi:hypothetical protein
MDDLLDSDRVRDSPLLADVERYLLLSLLTPAQRVSERRYGWFALPWPEMVLVLRVHTRAVPTVDAYQPRAGAGARGRRTQGGGDDGALDRPAPTLADLIVAARGERQAARPAAGATYLGSWDVRRVRRSADGATRFCRGSASPVGLARLVLEAHRRGTLAALLDAAETVRLCP